MTRRSLALAVSVVLLALLAPATLAGSDDWRSEADARIETLRKRDVEIVVADANGFPVAGAAVELTQTRHRFAFGSVVNFNLVENPSYRDFFLGHFEWAVLENETKWFYNEPMRDFVTFGRADGIVAVLEQHGIPTRGHCIFWAKEEYVPGWARTLPEAELREEVDERIDDAVQHFRGRFLHWDVNNEMLDGHFFRDHLGPSIRPHMFQRARSVDPEAILFVNDYSIIAGSAARTQAYINQINGLIADGAPVGGIGVQGHFWGDTVDPVAVLARLDQLAPLGLPVWVTEYDAVDADPVRRGEKLENLYRAAFSHPAVEGILMWGFWAGSHWRGADAAIVDLDWTLNAAGERYESLMSEWTTHVEESTGAEGAVAARAFHGAYSVTVTPPAGDPVTETLDVDPGADEARFLIPLVPGACFPAAEVESLELAGEISGATRLSWRAVPSRSDMGLVYDVLRSLDPAAFTSASCLESDGTDRVALDPDRPLPGTAFFYLVRAAYACPNGEGPLGSASTGLPRSGPPCP